MNGMLNRKMLINLKRSKAARATYAAIDHYSGSMKLYLSHDDQIGIGGASLSADLLINLGISGAVQYTVGIKNAKKIVSVNVDKDAPIFDESDFAYVGDVTDFLNALLAQVR